MAGLPYGVPRVCEDAVEFFKRMEELDERVAKHLDDEHRTRCELINAGRKEKPIYPNGTKVWFKHQQVCQHGCIVCGNDRVKC